MKSIKTHKLNESFPSNFFFQAISIYLKKTQVVNRKLSCSTNVVFLKLNLLTCQNQVKSKLIESLKEGSCDQENVKTRLEELGIEFVESDLHKLKDFCDDDDGFYLSIDRMLPRNLQKFSTCFVATIISKFGTCCFELT